MHLHNNHVYSIGTIYHQFCFDMYKRKCKCPKQLTRNFLQTQNKLEILANLFYIILNHDREGSTLMVFMNF